MKRRSVTLLLMLAFALAGSVQAAAAGPLAGGLPHSTNGYKDGG